MCPNTVRLHRLLATKPEKVYRAFIDADELAKWLPPNGFTCTVHQLEAKSRRHPSNVLPGFTTGNSHSFGGQYVELVPNERLRHTDKFTIQLAGSASGYGDTEKSTRRH
jgi:uncharacterized protein YndB with AHSA1/START domain